MPSTSIADRLVFAIVNAEMYLRHPVFTARYVRRMKRLPNLAAPSRLSELMQWRKLFDRNPLFTIFADKLLAKDWVRARCPDLAIPETVWVGDRPEDIPDELIAPGYVIKTNHGCDQNYFPHRETVDRATINARFDAWLRYSRAPGGEWAYGSVTPKVFVERLVPTTGPMLDIGVRSYDGRPAIASVAADFKTPAMRFGYFTMDGARMGGSTLKEYGVLPPDYQVPPNVLDQAKRFSNALSRGLDFIRVDFLYGGDRLYFSEMTFYAASGYAPDDDVASKIFDPWMRALGKSWFLSTPRRWPHSVYAAALRRWSEKLSAGPPVAEADRGRADATA